MSSWTDELKQTVIDEYLAQNPTPETTTEIVAELAEKHDKTANGLRLILSKAGAYVAQTTKKATPGKEDKAPRKSKQDSLDELSALIEAHGGEVDSTVVDKLTGKAAEYFITIINNIVEN